MAFSVLDQYRVGHFDLQAMKDIMMKDGEPFSQEEFEDMMRFGLDEEEQKFNWRRYMEKAGLQVSTDPDKEWTLDRN